MPRYKLTIEYDGGAYCGWQRQANGHAVQQAIEEAIYKFCGQALQIQGAGRTDAGVHATGQVAHVDLEKAWRTDQVRDAVNAHLWPHRIAIRKAELVAESFEARFSALKRHYLYKILNRRAPAVLERGYAWHVARKLDAFAMHEAAQCLVGKHDFSTFRDSECQANSPIRTLDRFDISRDGEMIEIRVSALSFLHRQVRSMVGSLEHVGSGKWSKENLVDALNAHDRKRCGQVAPADGLYLVGVDYPEK
jgi:tRNA pseudouridine38-40 synthase